MITFITTPHGAGVRLLGTFDELHNFYETIEHYWNCLEEASDPIELQRDNLLASFCYDIRHAYQGMRTVAKKHPVTKAEGEYFGVEITWTHILFYFAVLRHNMRMHPSTEEDIAAIKAKRLGCTIAELTYDYDQPPYDFVW